MKCTESWIELAIARQVVDRNKNVSKNQVGASSTFRGSHRHYCTVISSDSAGLSTLTMTAQRSIPPAACSVVAFDRSHRRNWTKLIFTHRHRDFLTTFGARKPPVSTQADKRLVSPKYLDVRISLVK